MKRTILLGALCTVILLSACNESTTQTTGDTPTQQSTKTPQVQTPEPVQITNSGTVSGKYDVEIVSARTVKDHNGTPCIVVTCNFTNNSDKNANMSTSVGLKVFQNKVECDTAILIGEVDAAKGLADVQPGGTITAEYGYKLQDTDNLVTIQAGPWVNLNDEINAQMEFNPAQ